MKLWLPPKDQGKNMSTPSKGWAGGRGNQNDWDQGGVGKISGVVEPFVHMSLYQY